MNPAAPSPASGLPQADDHRLVVDVLRAFPFER
jgi:uncharacterized protein (UPF0303 family)